MESLRQFQLFQYLFRRIIDNLRIQHKRGDRHTVCFADFRKAPSCLTEVTLKITLQHKGSLALFAFKHILIYQFGNRSANRDCADAILLGKLFFRSKTAAGQQFPAVYFV